MPTNTSAVPETESGTTTSDGAEKILQMHGVWKRFGAKEVFRGLDLDVRRGEILALLGPSGCGKSVLLKLIIGLMPVDQGEILWDGRHVEHFSLHELVALRRRVGMVFQGAALFDSLSVADNVAYGLRVEGSRGMAPDAVRERVAWALTAVGLADAGPLMPSELSGGMRKRVGVARTIALRPEVLLYDEPTTGLDPINSARIGDLIVALRDELKVTSVVVTHDVTLAARIADRMALLDAGKVAALGPAASVMGSTDPLVREFLDGVLEV
jgi:phospholipid/cholesterol/gamma-HCH transport system ATP-binding protein